MEIVKRIFTTIALAAAFGAALYIIFCATFWVVVWLAFKLWPVK